MKWLRRTSSQKCPWNISLNSTLHSALRNTYKHPSNFAPQQFQKSSKNVYIAIFQPFNTEPHPVHALLLTFRNIGFPEYQTYNEVTEVFPNDDENRHSWKPMFDGKVFSALIAQQRTIHTRIYEISNFWWCFASTTRCIVQQRSEASRNSSTSNYQSRASSALKQTEG